MPKKESDIAEAKKRIYLQVGVTAVSVFILLIWAFNLKQALNYSGTSKEVDQTWSRDMQEAITKIKDAASSNIDKEEGQNLLDEMAEGIKEKAAQEKETASSSLQQQEADQMIKDLAGKVASSSSATDNCPLFIDCMPGIGEAKSCAIPEGCENITQIAY